MGNIKNRPKLRAALPFSSPNHKSQPRLRKDERKRLYCQMMLELNTNFYHFAQKEEENIIQKIEAGELTATSTPYPPSGSYVENAKLYIREAAKIEKLMVEPTKEVIVFGKGECGQLGHQFKNEGSELLPHAPKCVRTLRNAGIISVSCGPFHTVSVNEKGQVY